MGNIRLIAGFISIWLFIGGLCLAVWRYDQELRTRLSEAEQRLAQMSKEHESAMQCVNEALQERERINAEQRDKIGKTEKALSSNPEFDNIPVPDDMRVCFGWDEDEGDTVSPPSDPAR